MDGGKSILDTVSFLYRVLDEGYVTIAGTPVPSPLYFSVIHQIVRLMMSRKFGKKLKDGVGLSTLETGRHKTFETVPIRTQSQMLVKAVWLLDKWPGRFVGICKQQKLFSSALLKDFEPAPFWYWKVVMESLYHPDRVVSVEEIQEAIAFMNAHGIPVSEFSLSKLVGVRQVFRKRKLKRLMFAGEVIDKHRPY